MKKHSMRAIVFCSVFFLGAAFLGAHVPAVAASLTGRAHVTNPMHVVPTPPLSGMVEGTVVATSTTSITIDQKTYRDGIASSTDQTFVLTSNVRIHLGQGYGTSSAMAVGSSVSLLLGHTPNGSGKVLEIRVMPSEGYQRVFGRTQGK